MMTALFESLFRGREIGSPGEDRLKLLKLSDENKCPPQQLVEWVNKKLATNGFRHTIILKIGCDPEVVENVIRLTDPGLGHAKRIQSESAVKYITGGETGSRSVGTGHYAAKITLQYRVQPPSMTSPVALSGVLQ
jgi:hypothetical protein